MKKILALAALLAIGQAQAAGQVDAPTYRAKCKGGTTQAVKFDYWCTVSVEPETPEAKVIVFTLQPPGDAPAIIVRNFRDHTATVDGVPAKERAITPGWFHFVTKQGIDLRFAKPPAGIEY